MTPTFCMFEYYATIRDVHMSAVLLSGLLFLLRTALLTRTRTWHSGALWLAALSVDTALATAALLLATILPASVFANGWLAAKLVAVGGYMACGYGGLSEQVSPARRRFLLVIAAIAYLTAVSIARAHHPLGPLHRLLG